MKDYHVYSMDDVMNGEITDHGVVLSTGDIPWAGRQLWDCDVAFKDGKYYMYFPLKDQNDIFRIGVAVSDKPYGPFVPEANPMKGSYSIDPAVWNDGDGNYYMYFGGLWGGCLLYTSKHPQVRCDSVNYSQKPWAEQPTQMVSYVSCHDGLCLVDRLKASMPGATPEQLVRLDKLAQTVVLTSQGIPFIYAGEEVMRCV